MKIFLIAGKAGSGKNEVANIIKNNLENTVITGFSKYIKLFALELSNWDGRDINKPREFLQNMGDDLRAVDKNFLTKRLLEDIIIYKNKGIENVIISDVRLINEIEYFKQNCNENVITIRVNSNNFKRSLTDSEMKHHTELELDNYENFDYVILNSFDESLNKMVINILKGLK